jgi:hypothetical protein
VHDLERPREVCEEHRARLQRRDEERLTALVLLSEESAQLRDTGRDLVTGEVDLSDRPVG